MCNKGMPGAAIWSTAWVMAVVIRAIWGKSLCVTKNPSSSTTIQLRSQRRPARVSSESEKSIPLQDFNG